MIIFLYEFSAHAADRPLRAGLEGGFVCGLREVRRIRADLSPLRVFLLLDGNLIYRYFAVCGDNV